MKRRMRQILAAAVLVMLSACSAPQYDTAGTNDLSVYFSNSDEIIQTVREALKMRSAAVTVGYRSGSDNMRDIPAVVNGIMMSAMSETDDPCEGDYIYHQYGGYDLEYSSTRDGGDYLYTITVTPVYYTYPSQEETVNCRVNEVISSLITDGMTDTEKITAIYDYVYEHVSYDRVHKNNRYYHLKTTAYAALVNGCAVCQGYSVLMYRLLREAGINARVITGNAVNAAGTEYHAWNIAEADGKYYNIDITWDKLDGTRNYFMKGEDSFSAEHIRDDRYMTEEFLAEYPVSAEDLTV